MSETKGNESAFPVTLTNPTDGEGLTKREYFAALAMQGKLASGCLLPVTSLAEESVIYADALIEALNAN